MACGVVSALLTWALLASAVILTHQSAIDDTDETKLSVGHGKLPEHQEKLLGLLLKLASIAKKQEIEKKELSKPAAVSMDEHEENGDDENEGEDDEHDGEDDEDEGEDDEDEDEEEYRQCKNGKGGCFAICGDSYRCSCHEGHCRAVCWCDGKDRNNPICECKPKLV